VDIAGLRLDDVRFVRKRVIVISNSVLESRCLVDTRGSRMDGKDCAAAESWWGEGGAKRA
jgi:hypothetical protein